LARRIGLAKVTILALVGALISFFLQNLGQESPRL
jgi:hypothetical protein